MDILEKFNKKNFPRVRPTTKECVAAIKNPEVAPQEIKKYLELHPEYEKFIRAMFDLPGI